MAMAKGSDADDWAIAKEIAGWIDWHGLAKWASANVVVVRWQLILLWGWSMLCASSSGVAEVRRTIVANRRPGEPAAVAHAQTPEVLGLQ
jgi:hypothetical protein